MKLSVVILSLVIFGNACCWHELGHMLTARVAQKKLVDLGLNPDAFTWAQNILAPLQDMAGEQNYPFVECAGWPDKLKSLSVNQFNNWHFVDIPVFANGFNKSDINQDMQNITKIMYNSFATLSANPNEKPGRGKAIFGKSTMLRFAIHFFGDIHQPLHCSNRYSPQHPDGDMGGNLFSVYFKNKKTDLHTVWDAIFYAYPELQSPLSSDSWRQISEITENLFSRYGNSDPLADSLSFSSLADYATIGTETNRLSTSYAYNNIVEGAILSDSYIATATEISLRRIHQGGLRLAAFIDKVYKKGQGIKFGNEVPFIDEDFVRQ